MIKVIEKVFKALEILHPDRSQSLTSIARRTQINKATLCNMFKTLSELGYIENDGHGSYRLSRQFMEIGAASSNRTQIERSCMAFCTELAGKTRESAVIATLAGGRVDIIAQARFERALMMNLEIYRNLSLWRSTSGRILLAFLEEQELRSLLCETGYPRHLWENAEDFKSLNELLQPIRKRKMAVMVNTAEHFTAFSVPIFDGAGELCGCIGLTVPQFRLEGVEEKIVHELKSCGRRLTEWNTELNLTAKDWRKR